MKREKLSKNNSKVSIQKRLLLTIAVSLVSLIVANMSLKTYFAKSIYLNTRSHLHNMASEYAKLFFIKNGKLKIKENLSKENKEMLKKDSSLYIVVLKNNKIYWVSPSVDSKKIPLSSSIKERYKKSVSAPGFFAYGDPSKIDNRHIFIMPFFPTKKEDTSNANNDMYRIMVYENGGLADSKIRAYSYALWIALLVSFTFILIAQSITAKWSLRPLKSLREDLSRVRTGESSALSHNYPHELQGITQGFNDLISHEQKQTLRYKDSLSNLAHSFKTPLAIINTMIDNKDIPDSLKEDLKKQIRRMEDMVSYQLSYASRGGHHLYLKNMELEKPTFEIIDSLEKLYKHKGAVCGVDFCDDMSYPINRGDYQELMGNLLENAFKWCNHTVNLTIKKIVSQETKNKESFLMVKVEDDGKGIKKENLGKIRIRGIRADEKVKGHGIGLDIVNDIVTSYNGELEISNSKEFSGACFIIKLPY